MKWKCFIFFSLCCFASCKLVKDNVIWIDNPSSKQLSVLISNNSYLIPAYGGVEITIEDGTYDIDVQDDSTKRLLKHHDQIHIDKDGILNVTDETYVIVNQAYYTKPDVNVNAEKIKNEVLIGQYTYKGDISLIGKDSFFIPKSWTFGLKEELSPTQQQNVDYAMITKIYRKVDFEIDFLRNAAH